MDVTKEEFYRALDGLNETLHAASVATANIRVEITAMALTVALLRHDLELLKQTKRDYREWIAMTVIGAVIAAVDYVIHKIVR